MSPAPCTIQPSITNDLRYKQLKGTEPLYTNWARTARDDSDFIATLDYIFVHPAEAVATTEVLELPTTTDVVASMGPYPTETEPSDHVMIAASMRIRA
jgi:mRNA deadenylase 3'-5' endonuclease subunit Ccr4